MLHTCVVLHMCVVDCVVRCARCVRTQCVLSIALHKRVVLHACIARCAKACCAHACPAVHASMLCALRMCVNTRVCHVLCTPACCVLRVACCVSCVACFFSFPVKNHLHFREKISFLGERTAFRGNNSNFFF